MAVKQGGDGAVHASIEWGPTQLWVPALPNSARRTLCATCHYWRRQGAADMLIEDLYGTNHLRPEANGHILSTATVDKTKAL